MRLGDLVKFIEKHKNGFVKETIGLVVEKRDTASGLETKPIYRIKWFDQGAADSWHISPSKSAKAKDLYVISAAVQLDPKNE